MKVLSIDLDYCMDTCMEMIDSTQINPYIDENPVSRWKAFEDHTIIPDQSVFIDEDKVEYCFDVYQKALKHCNNVMFAYDHDAILYRLEMDDAYDLDIINIDHHADMLNGNPYNENMELFNFDEEEVIDYEFSNFQDGKVMEGNWVGWLEWKNKLNSYTWIHGVRSIGTTEHSKGRSVSELHSKYFSSDIEYYLKENYTFDDYDFDFIFVCLSPGYMPQKYWNIFRKYLSEYEKIIGESYSYKLVNRKYEIDARYRELHKYTLPL